MRKVGRHVNAPVYNSQPPGEQMLLFRLDDIEKQNQEHRAKGIAADGQGGSPKPAEFACGEVVLPDVLGDQDEAEDDDDSHNPAVLPADIGVDDHGGRQPDQQKQQRNQQSRCVQIPDHVTSSPSLAGSISQIKRPLYFTVAA